MELQSQHIVSFLLGLGLICGPLGAVFLIKYLFFVEVREGQHLLVLHFGKLLHHRQDPGLYFCPHILPWVQVLPVSVQRDFREYAHVSVNDSRGTSLKVTFWVELRIFDPIRAVFQVENWEESLKSYILHSSTSLLSSMDFMQIHKGRIQLGELLREKVGQVTQRWGIEVEMLMIKDLEITPEISKQMIHAVSARLERDKANIEEEGRLKVARLEAETSMRIAECLAQAKGQYPAAVDRAYEILRKKPGILSAYTELYEYSQIRPHRTSVFLGFAQEELPASYASMIVPPLQNQAQKERGTLEV